MEINPKHDQNHRSVFEMKSEKPLGLNIYKGKFYLIDQKKKVYEMERMKQHRNLHELNTYVIKDKDL